MRGKTNMKIVNSKIAHFLKLRSSCAAEILSELTESDRSIIHQFLSNNFTTSWTRGESSDSALR